MPVNYNIIKLATLFGLILSINIFSFAFEPEIGENNILFKISRSRDANEIHYEVKTTAQGALDLEEPITIYWIKYNKQGTVEPLTIIQQKFAYGLKFLDVTPEKADFQFVSYSKRTLSLRKTEEGDFAVFVSIDDKEVKLERVFIQIDGGTFWFPKISRVEVHAKKAEANELVVEVIRP